MLEKWGEQVNIIIEFNLDNVMYLKWESSF